MDMQSKKARKLIIATAIQMMLSTSLMAATDRWETTENYLDPAVWSKEVNDKTCFQAAPKSVLEVQPVVTAGQRLYQVKHIYDIDLQRKLYAKSISDQIADRHFVGQKFCQGIISNSDMQRTITKSDDIEDANDGLLLVDKVRHDILEIAEHLNQMTVLATKAASGIYSSSELYDLNIEFKAHMKEMNVIATRSHFNHINLLDGSMPSVNVPIHQGHDFVHVTLSNMTIHSDGLDISNIKISGSHFAQQSLEKLTSITSIAKELSLLKKSEIKLQSAAKKDSTITSVDLRTDEFTVQRKEPSSEANKA